MSDGAHLLRPQARLIENSAFPFQEGGGPTWAGRGLTGDVQLGGSASWDFVYAQLAPLAFATQNLAFPLAPNGQTGNARFADPRFPREIDAPQRFGDTQYSRLDPGSSSLFLDARRRGGWRNDSSAAMGPCARVSAGAQSRTPAGFRQPSSEPASRSNLWLFRIHTRLGVQQARTNRRSLHWILATPKRLGSGVVGTIEPRGLPGLEIGGARFIHNLWPHDGITLTELRRPLSSGNLFSLANNIQTENQVASVFARWALPAAKAEFYGEFYREDFPGHFHSSLSLVEKPDDLAAFTLGFQRVFTAGSRLYRVIRGEIVNSQVSHQERETRGFTQPLPPYIHTVETQGHTVDGLILGSPEAYGGAAWRFGIDEYSPSGRRTLSLERSLRFDWLPTDTTNTTLVHPDVIYALRAEVVRFRGNVDWGFTLIPAIDLNRNLVAGRDVFNLSLALTLGGWP